MCIVHGMRIRHLKDALSSHYCGGALRPKLSEKLEVAVKTMPCQVSQHCKRPHSRQLSGLEPALVNYKQDNFHVQVVRSVFNAVPIEIVRCCVVVGSDPRTNKSDLDILFYEPSGEVGSWFGILIESHLEQFRRLKYYHKQRGNVRCLHADVAANEGTDLVAVLRRYARELPASFDYLNINCSGSYSILNDFFQAGSFYPKLISVPFHDEMPPDQISIPKPHHNPNGNASLAAVIAMAQYHGYELIAISCRLAFFVQRLLYEECLKSEFPDTSISGVRRETASIEGISNAQQHTFAAIRNSSPTPPAPSSQTTKLKEANSHEQLNIPALIHDHIPSPVPRKAKRRAEPPGCIARNTLCHGKTSFTTSSRKCPPLTLACPLKRIPSDQYNCRAIDYTPFPWLRQSRNGKFIPSDASETHSQGFPKTLARDPPEERTSNAARSSPFDHNSLQAIQQSSLSDPPTRQGQGTSNENPGQVETGTILQDFAHRSSPKVKAHVSTSSQGSIIRNNSVHPEFQFAGINHDVTPSVPPYEYEAKDTILPDGPQTLSILGTGDETYISDLSTIENATVMLDQILAELPPSGDFESRTSTATADHGGPTRTFSPECVLKQHSLDISPCFQRRRSQALARRKCGESLVRRLCDEGYVMIRGTGISRFTCADAVDAANSFLQEADESVRRSCTHGQQESSQGYSPVLSEGQENDELRDMVRRFRVGYSSDVPPWPDEAVWGEAANHFRCSMQDYIAAASKVVTETARCITEYLSEHEKLHKSVVSLTDSLGRPGSIQLTLVGARRGSRHIMLNKPLITPRTEENTLNLTIIDGGDSAIFQLESDEQTWRNAPFPRVLPDDPIFLLYPGRQLNALSNGIIPCRKFRLIPAAGASPVNIVTLSVCLHCESESLRPHACVPKILLDTEGEGLLSVPKEDENVSTPPTAMDIREQVRAASSNAHGFKQANSRGDSPDFQQHLSYHDQSTVLPHTEKRSIEDELSFGCTGVRSVCDAMDRVARAKSRVQKKLNMLREERHHHNSWNSMADPLISKSKDLSTTTFAGNLVPDSQCGSGSGFSHPSSQNLIGSDKQGWFRSQDPPSQEFSSRGGEGRPFLPNEGIPLNQRTSLGTWTHTLDANETVQTAAKSVSPLSLDRIRPSDTELIPRDTYLLDKRDESLSPKPKPMQSTPQARNTAAESKNLLLDLPAYGECSADRLSLNNRDYKIVRTLELNRPMERTNGYTVMASIPDFETWPPAPGSPLRPIQVIEAPGSRTTPIDVHAFQYLTVPSLPSDTTYNISEKLDQVDQSEGSFGTQSTQDHNYIVPLDWKTDSTQQPTDNSNCYLKTKMKGDSSVVHRGADRNGPKDTNGNGDHDLTESHPRTSLKPRDPPADRVHDSKAADFPIKRAFGGHLSDGHSRLREVCTEGTTRPFPADLPTSILSCEEGCESRQDPVTSDRQFVVSKLSFDDKYKPIYNAIQQPTSCSSDDTNSRSRMEGYYDYGALIDDSTTVSHEVPKHLRESPEHDMPRKRIGDGNSVSVENSLRVPLGGKRTPTADGTEKRGRLSNSRSHERLDDIEVNSSLDIFHRRELIPSSHESSEHTEKRKNTQYPSSESDASHSRSINTTTSESANDGRAARRELVETRIQPKRLKSMNFIGNLLTEKEECAGPTGIQSSGCLVMDARDWTIRRPCLSGIDEHRETEEEFEFQMIQVESEDERVAIPRQVLGGLEEATQQSSKIGLRKQLVERGTTRKEHMMYNSWDQLSLDLQHVGPQSIGSVSEMTEDPKAPGLGCLGDLGDSFKAMRLDL